MVEDPKTQSMEVKNSNLSEKARHDYELVLRAVEKKDQQAYAELMGRYRDSIYFMLLKMVNNRDDADDLTIEAFGKAFSRLHQYTPSYAFSSVLVIACCPTTSLNVCGRYLRADTINCSMNEL